MRTFLEKPKSTSQAECACFAKPAQPHTSRSHEAQSVSRLQPAIENQSLHRPLNVDAETPEADFSTTASTHFAYDFSRIAVQAKAPGWIQPKLTVGTPGDLFEHEADRVAEQVMRMPEPTRQRTGACGGECPKCRNEQSGSPGLPINSMQTDTVGRSDDRFGQEVNRFADGITSVHRVPENRPQMSPRPNPHANQEWQDVRQNRNDEPSSPQVDNGFQNTLKIEEGNGRPLPHAARAFFESRFGLSFRHVQIHDGPQAAALTREISARAFTRGEHIYFAEGQPDLNSTGGRRLMAHELTHTLQQGASAHRATGLSTDRFAKARPDGLMSRTPEMRIQRSPWEDVLIGGRLVSYTDRAGANTRMAQLRAQHRDLDYRVVERDGHFVVQLRTPPQRCGRRDYRVSGFPDPFISQIDVNLGNLASGLHITWNRATAETAALPSTFPISPGAGRCTKCCDNISVSHEVASLCTPKGNFHVDLIGNRSPHCQLSDTSWATNATFFAANVRSGIAIHTGPRPGHPASHGCVRTTPEGSAIIHDNSRVRNTAVHVGGTWSGTHCYGNIIEHHHNHPDTVRFGIHPRVGAELCGRSTQAAPRQAGTHHAAAQPQKAPNDGAGSA